MITPPATRGAAAGRLAAVPPRRPTRWWRLGLIVPVVLTLVVVFLYPLMRIVGLSFIEPSPGVDNYAALLNDGVTVKVMIRTVVMAVIVAITTLVLAYPYAYAMTKVGKSTRALLTIIVLMPFWTSLIARTFAWYLLEQQGGWLEQFFALLGFDNVVLLGTTAGVTLAMVQMMLPYMVLPLYSAMAGIDQRLIMAARTLGAPRWTAFRTVYLPQSVPGVVSGLTLVFIVSLGFYVTPALLGSPSEALLSQVIAVRVNKLLDFAGAGALGVVLLGVALLLLLALSRIAKPSVVRKEVTGQ